MVFASISIWIVYYNEKSFNWVGHKFFVHWCSHILCLRIKLKFKSSIKSVLHHVYSTMAWDCIMVFSFIIYFDASVPSIQSYQ